ncbi:MAG: DsbA family protein [Candidatus Omnitrophica bacterium]|nr:DsbA family protein [Candidatus Omnitrophota bacterium]
MRSAILGAVLMLMGVMAGRLLSGSSSPSGLTKAEAQQILDELKQLRAAVERAPAPAVAQAAAPAAPTQPQTVSVSIEGSPSMGRDDAPLTLVEFADIQCPFCGRFHTQTFPQLKENFIDKGLLRFVSRDLPLPFHGEAEKAALAARCAGDQGRYWEMRDALLKAPSTLSTDTMLAQAATLSLNADQFKDCLDQKKYADVVQKDASDAQAAGLGGTPSFVLGKTSGNTVQGVAIVGAQPYASFESKIKELLPKE